MMKLRPLQIFYSALVLASTTPLVHGLAVVESRTGEPIVRRSFDGEESLYSEGEAPSVSATHSRVDRVSSTNSMVEGRAARLTLKQIEALKQEVSELRGLIEIQQHDIEQLKKSQQDFYLDLDKRLSQLQQNPSAGVIKSKAKTGSISSIVIEPKGGGPKESGQPLKESKSLSKSMVAPISVPAPISTTSTTASAPATEKAAYEVAYNLMRTKQYSEAITAFQDYLTRFPTGAQAPNAHYWLGEVYMLQWQSGKTDQNLLDKSSQAFLSVTSQFPKHQKVADALLKLGMIEQEKGDWEAARQYFTQVKDRYPGMAAARIAETQLQQFN